MSTTGINEILLKENPDRFSLFPIKYKDIWELYEKAESAFWTAKVINFSADAKKWKELTDDEKFFVSHILAFFNSSDLLVNENLALRFLGEIQIPEARCLLGFQYMMENIHSQVYAQMINEYIQDGQERDRLFKAVQNIPTIAKKADWMQKWTHSNLPYGFRVIAFACVELLFFSGAFAAVYWLKNKLRSAFIANEYIRRDEALHVQTAILLFNNYVSAKPKQDDIHALVIEAVAYETEFITESLPVRLIGMNSALMISRIKFLADWLLEEIGYETIYGDSDPFPEMQNFELQGKTNFFENHSTSYARANLSGVSSETQEKNKDDDLFGENLLK